MAFRRRSGTRRLSVQSHTDGADQRVCRHSGTTRHRKDVHWAKGKRRESSVTVLGISHCKVRAHFRDVHETHH